jgi:hypothetical protein
MRLTAPPLGAQRRRVPLRLRSIAPLVSMLAACAPPPAAPKPMAAPPAPPTFAAWTPLDAPPSPAESRAVVRSGDRELRLDAAGARWLFRPGAEPARSAGYESARLGSIMLLERGVLMVTDGGQVLQAGDDLGPLARVLELPPGTDPQAAALYRGGVTLSGEAGVAFLRPPASAGEPPPAPVWLPPFEERRPLDARIGADCQGLVLFTPQRLASTRDCGKTYQPIDDRGVYAASLLVDGERVIVDPGGEHDVFARAFTPGAAGLARSLHASSEEQPARSAREKQPPALSAESLRRAVDAAAPIRALAAGFLRHLEKGAVVAEGDRVFFFAAGAPFGAGTLGGPITWIDGSKRWPERLHRGTGFTACAGTRVITTGGGHLWTEGGDEKRYAEAAAALRKAQPSQVALHGSDLLFYDTLDGVYRVDLRGPWAPVRVVRSRGGALRVRCDASQPSPLWLDETRVVPAARAFAPKPDDAEPPVTVTLPPSFTGPPLPLGMTRDGSLMVRDRGGTALAVLHEDSTAEAHPWPGEGEPLAVAGNDEGRALAVERKTGRAYQSLDAGATWAETRGPGRPIGGAGLFCSATRCEVEGLFLRRGWDEAAPELPAPAAPLPAPEPTLGPAVACELAPDASPRLPPGVAKDDVTLTFGPAGALWAGMGLASGKEDEESYGSAGPEAQRTLTMLIGGADGRVLQARAMAWKGPRATTTSTVLAGEGALFLWMDARGLTGNVISAQPNALGAYAPDGRAPPRRLKTNLGEVAYALGGFAFAPAPFATATGLAVLDTRDREVLWLDARGAPERRGWPDDAWGRKSEDPDAHDALAKRPDDTWIAVESGPEWVRLVTAAKDGVTATRTLSRARFAEQGAGILASGADVDVALVEREPSGPLALRLHRVDAELGLGPPRTIPGTAGPSAPLSFPACGAAPPAGVMELRAPIEVVVGGIRAPATLLRRVRFDAAGACVARSQLRGEKGLQVVTLGGIDGPAVMSRPERTLEGARCRWRR